MAGSLTVFVGELLSGAAGDVVALAVALVVASGYELVFLRALRATPGKLMAGVRIAERDGWAAGEVRGLSGGQALVRSAIVGAAVVLPVLGLVYAAACLLAVARQPLRLMPHDLAARSIVTLRA